MSEAFENVIEVDTATVYKLRRRPSVYGFGWADATIREWPRGGSITVQSDYGTFANSWTAVGDVTLREFLCDLDFDYFMGKARPGYRQFDAEKTVKALRQNILERRRQEPDWLSAEAARECWDAISTFDLEQTQSHTEFYTSFMRSPDLERLSDGDYAGLAKESPDPNAVAFWRECWPQFTAKWRGEIASLKARTSQ